MRDIIATVGGIKGNVLRLLYKVGIIAISLALAVLAFPISTAQAKQERLVFVIDPTLSQPKVIEPIVPEKPKEIPKPKVSKTKVPQTKGFNPCNCVSYVQFKTGRVVKGIGVARNHPVTPGAVCTIGAIIVTYESKAGHLGVVAGCSPTEVTIDDYNYSRCGHTIRTLPLSSKLIKGYYL